MHTPQSSAGVILLLLLSVCFAAAQETPSHCDVFVSNAKGNDAGSGSIHSPFKTLNRALQSAKETESYTYLICVEQASYEGQSNEQLQTDTSLSTTVQFCAWDGSSQSGCSQTAVATLPSLDLSKSKQLLLSFFNFHLGKFVDTRATTTTLVNRFENCLFTGDTQVKLGQSGLYTFISSEWKASGGTRVSSLSFDLETLNASFQSCSFQSVELNIKADVVFSTISLEDSLLQLQTTTQSFLKGKNQFIRSSLLVKVEQGLFFADNSTFSEGGYSSRPLVEFAGDTLRFTDCSFERNVVDQSVLLSLSGRTVGISGSTFSQNSVKESTSSALIAIHNNPDLVIVRDNTFSCNAIRLNDGQMRYPFPVQLNVAKTYSIYASGNIVSGCPITDKCTDGNYSPNNVISCGPCPPGQYYNAYECISCPAGTTNSQTGQSIQACLKSSSGTKKQVQEKLLASGICAELNMTYFIVLTILIL